MFLKRVLHKPIGKILIDKNIISQDQLEEALSTKEQEGGYVGEILIKRGFVSESQIVFALMSQYEVPYCPVDKYPSDLDIFMLFPLFSMEKFVFLPVEKLGDVVSIATFDPINTEMIDFIHVETGFTPTLFICEREKIMAKLQKYKEQYGLA